MKYLELLEPRLVDLKLAAAGQILTIEEDADELIQWARKLVHEGVARFIEYIEDEQDNQDNQEPTVPETASLQTTAAPTLPKTEKAVVVPGNAATVPPKAKPKGKATPQT